MKELRQAIKHFLKKRNDMYEECLVLIQKLPKRNKDLYLFVLLIKTYKTKKYNKDFLLQASYSFYNNMFKKIWLKKVLNMFVQDGDLQKSLQAVQEIGCHIKKRELELILKNQIKKTCITNAAEEGYFDKNILQTLELLDRDLTEREIMRILQVIIIDKKWAPMGIEDIANMLSEPERTYWLEQILKRQVKDWWLEPAQKTARLLGRKLTTEELESILCYIICVPDKECCDNAKKIARLLNRDLMIKDYERALEIQTNKGRLDNAERLARVLLKRDLTENEIKKGIEVNIEDNDIVRANEISVKFFKRSLSMECLIKVLVKNLTNTSKIREIIKIMEFDNNKEV